MSINIAVYAEGCMYPSGGVPVAANIAALQRSGFTTAILSLFHIGRDYNIEPSQVSGDLYYNDTLIISRGEYVGDASWPKLVDSIGDGSVQRVCASIGGGGVLDFTTINRIYTQNGQSFANTNLERSLRTFRKVFPSVDILDLDNEDDYSEPSFLAFCQLVIGMGFRVTFCPYTAQDFWVRSLSALNASSPGAVAWWNLQCYDGGAGNEPQAWADAICRAVPGFNPTGFIVAGDWTSDSPGQVESLMSGFAAQPSVGGGFMWTFDEMLASSVGPGKYAEAIRAGLG